jgi:XTP/dITP diphosphohydrolase
VSHAGLSKRLPTEWVLASRNAGKLAEMQALLAPLGLRVRLVSEFTDEAAAETAPTFVENALLKARHAAQLSGLAAIADDSGLEVAALGGAPGVWSARYAGNGASDAANNAKLLKALVDVPEAARGARFVSVVVALRHAADPTPIIAQGFWSGRILAAPRGRGGFGYDPLFGLPELDCAAAELEPAIKNRLSHRGQAMAMLIQQLRAHGD